MEEAAYPPLHYAAALSGLGATCVVRLNEADTYDAGEFVRAGLRHQVGIVRGDSRWRARTMLISECCKTKNHLFKTGFVIFLCVLA